MGLHTETHAVALPSGATVSRMPVGLAAGLWWLHFVVSDTAALRASVQDRHDLFELVRAMVAVSTSDGLEVWPPSGNDDGEVVELHYRIRASDPLEVSVLYLNAGQEVAQERLALA